ncbi:MAG: hypothetical protein WCO06_05950 [Candidatus Roizmanbacteria bacterium]
MRPSEVLGTYCFFPWAEIYDNIYQVKGGIYSIVEGFTKLAIENGVKFQYETEITKINYDGNVMTNVSTNKGNYDADIFVNNIDGAYFYSQLMPKEKNKTYTLKKLKKMTHTNSYFAINLGLKNPIPQYSHHTFFVSKKWEEFTENILKPNAVNKFNFDNTCYYFLQPSALEPILAPEGKATAFILIPVCGYDPEFDWKSYSDTFKNYIYDVMEHRDGIPIRSLIEVEEIYNPDQWGKEFNLWENIILSFSLNFI